MSILTELQRRNVLRVAVAYLVLSWLLVQVADILLPTFEAPAWVMRVLVLVLAAGFVATLVFSWAYEITPEGVKRESEIERSDAGTNRTARKLDIAVIAMLLAVAALALLTRGGDPGADPAPQRAHTETAKEQDAKLLAAGDVAKTAPPHAPSDPRPSVAVLPFVNLSTLAENEYFADGLSETLLNMLAQVSGLKVAARTSAFAFKGSKTDIREIARTLDVRTVLEGSVQRAGDRVRITAQLIDARDGSHLWSKSYDRTLEDIFAIQDEIAGSVAAELTRSLFGATGAAPGAVASVETRDTNAYDVYLRGLEQRNISSFASLPKAERLFKQALELDPEFTDARIAIARTYFVMANTGLLGEAEAAQRGRPLLAPLLEGASPHPVARAYDAILRWFREDTGERATVAAEVRGTVMEALAQAPNAVELYELAALTLRGDEVRAAEALGIVERGLALDPLSLVMLNAKGRQLRNMKRFDESLATYASMRELAPENPNGYSGAAFVYSERGPFIEAVRWYAHAATIDRDDHELPAAAAQHLLMMGVDAEALPWIARAELLNAAGSDTRRVRLQYAAVTGDVDRAIALATEMIRERRDNRRAAYSTAVAVYIAVMSAANRGDEALATLVGASPGMFDDPPKLPATEFDLINQWGAAQLLVGRWNAAERKTRLDQLTAAMHAIQPFAKLDRGHRGMLLAAMRGDTKQAAALLESVLADPAQLPWAWRFALRSPALVDVVKDPRVVAATARFEADLAQQAARYRELVAAGEIVVP